MKLFKENNVLFKEEQFLGANKNFRVLYFIFIFFKKSFSKKKNLTPS